MRARDVLTRGLRLIVPGWPQRGGDRGPRGAVLMGSYASSILVCGFAWGTALGAALLAFAFALHAASVADAIRRDSFPGFGRWAPWFSAMVGLGAAGYLPALALSLQLAYPARTPEGGYFVNRVALAERPPEPGHRVWLDRDGPIGTRCVARVVAVGGQVVSWSEAGFLVDGRAPRLGPGEALPPPRASGAFEVPTDTLLIASPAPGPAGAAEEGGGVGSIRLAIVPVDRVLGRAWARSYPIWQRRLLG